jgi:hypothetical protein
MLTEGILFIYCEECKKKIIEIFTSNQLKKLILTLHVIRNRLNNNKSLTNNEQKQKMI